METLVNLALVGLAGLVIWWICRPRYVFVVRIVDGQPRVAQGKVAAPFLEELRDGCARHDVRQGEVRGAARQGRIALTFSRHLPAPLRQQLRNWWAISGWPPPP